MKRKLFDKAKGLKLDIGCGLFKQKGCIGMDMVKHPSVDIQHDVQKFPWPILSSSCTFILMSHLWEHIEPKYRFQIMDECWRICRHDGQLFIACPYAGSYLEAAHPAHYMCPNEATFQFFDSDYQLWHSCSYDKPKPWKLIRNDGVIGGTIEVILEPRKKANGRAEKPPAQAVKYGAVALLERKMPEDAHYTKPKKKKRKRK
jgi:hypothetical protein